MREEATFWTSRQQVGSDAAKHLFAQARMSIGACHYKICTTLFRC
jgi:hypothetical protein